MKHFLGWLAILFCLAFAGKALLAQEDSAHFWVDPSSFGTISPPTAVCPEGAIETWTDLSPFARRFGQDDEFDRRPCWVADCGFDWPCLQGHRQAGPGEGDGSQLEIEWGEDFSLLGGYSLFVLLEPQASGLEQTLLSSGTYSIRLLPDLSLFFDGSAWQDNRIIGLPLAQAWQLLEIHCNGSTCEVLSDGADLSTGAATNTAFHYRYVATQNKGHRSYTGRMMATAAYDRLLSETEREAVRDAMNVFRGGPPPPPPPPRSATIQNLGPDSADVSLTVGAAICAATLAAGETLECSE